MKRSAHRLIYFILLIVSAALFSGCDDNEPDHTPPPGQGAIYIDNRTSSDIRVFIDGLEQDRVRAFKSRAYDRPPGLYRIVLDQRRGDRTFRDDVDVLADRLTVLDVANDSFNFSRFDVAVFFRTP